MTKTQILAVAATSLILAGCGKEAAQPAKEVTVETLEEKVSYLLGYNMASQAKANDFVINADVMALAVQEVNDGKEQRFTDEEMQATMRSFQTDQNAKRQEKVSKLIEKNTQAAKEFLEANAKKEGVVQTESGLQYKILTKGEGAIPTAKDHVLAHYRGTTLDGNEFDSSYKRGEPAKFPVGGLIPGWVEALQIMPVGSKWELYIPGELAYGPGGKMNPATRQYDIEPNALLIFELELLDINPDEKAKEEAEAKPAEEAKPAK
ncbi:FKBP-type peptidyl-prolyl cis-trans isomerase FkpA/FKBP-type peptidyl-prolyl cis-trans isomerase FklB [Alteromonadaceae bacterium 2753L.S.0a.02]|nr:FKBP-type peptidyl-prolyl cis-trans isomerase FkpA/FKBP-type peptidyl-prolyl cis-trans isomerase FklB [Alteromonadaceae bacterium 2753L.S.0a.02]